MLSLSLVIRLAAKIGVVAVALSPSMLSAAMFLATYTGTVASGYDTSGEFGSKGVRLNGQSFVATYLFQAPSPNSVLLESISASGSFRSIYGGVNYSINSESPILAADLTIGGAKRVIFSRDFGSIFIQDKGNNNIDQLLVDVQSVTGTASFLSTTDRMFFSLISSTNFVESVDFAGYFEYVPTTQKVPGGAFSFQGYDVRSAMMVHDAYGYFNISKVVIRSVASEVPDVASWLSMVIGFGALGAWVRVSRNRVRSRYLA